MKVDLEFYSTKKGITWMRERKNLGFTFQEETIKKENEELPAYYPDFYLQILKRIHKIILVHGIYEDWEDKEFYALLLYTSSLVDELKKELCDDMCKADEIDSILRKIYFSAYSCMKDKILLEGAITWCKLVMTWREV